MQCRHSTHHTVVCYPGTSTDPCLCPAGFSRCAGRCLHFVDQFVNYTEATRTCADLGAHLATPRNAEDNACLYGMAVNMWIGYRGDGDPENFLGEDGCWYLDEASPFIDDLYLTTNDQCMVISLTSSGWYDVSCAIDDTFKFVCQIPECYKGECPDQQIDG